MSTEQGTGYPTLCRNGCGFFCGVDSKGLCSVCYKEFVKKDGDGNKVDEDMENTSASLANLSMDASSDVATVGDIDAKHQLGAVSRSEQLPKPSLDEHADEKSRTEAGPEEVKGEEETKTEEPTKKKKSRCLCCKKKLGLTGFTCRCGGLFCGIHRYSDKHDCSFDYNAMGKKEIAEANPLIVAEKVAKI